MPDKKPTPPTEQEATDKLKQLTEQVSAPPVAVEVKSKEQIKDAFAVKHGYNNWVDYMNFIKLTKPPIHNIFNIINSLLEDTINQHAQQFQKFSLLKDEGCVTGINSNASLPRAGGVKNQILEAAELLNRSIVSADPTGYDVIIKDLREQSDKLLYLLNAQQFQSPVPVADFIRVLENSMHKNLIIVDISLNENNPDYTIQGQDLVIKEMSRATAPASSPVQGVASNMDSYFMGHKDGRTFIDEQLQGFVKMVFIEAQKGGGYTKEVGDYFLTLLPESVITTPPVPAVSQVDDMAFSTATIAIMAATKNTKNNNVIDIDAGIAAVKSFLSKLPQSHPRASSSPQAVGEGSDDKSISEQLKNIWNNK